MGFGRGGGGEDNWGKKQRMGGGKAKKKERDWSRNYDFNTGPIFQSGK